MTRDASLAALKFSPQSACAARKMASSPRAGSRTWTLAGVGALGLAVAFAAAAQDSSAMAAMGQHMALCLSGAQAKAAGVWTFAGHCAACWSALALSAVGAAAVLKGRVGSLR